MEPLPDPGNTYDAERTYTELVRHYPFIRIASAAVPDEVRVVRDLTYVRYGKRCLKLDLFLPAQSRAHALHRAAPAVVFIHGGGWNAGYRSEFVPMALALARRGYAAATISYRLAGEAGYPAAVDDARAAVRWVRRHAARYGIDAEQIVLAGGSAGAQIASLAGLTANLHPFDPEARSQEPGSLGYGASHRQRGRHIRFHSRGVAPPWQRSAKASLTCRGLAGRTLYGERRRVA